ncbi:MAG: hypothetical protein MUE45_03375 [Methanoregulaceae archaeon]|nr:hypothetical protein [Methanoregulaceae archaeon]MCU0628520.1 hypothetical protein [Methanoregulaceae archaeon]
MSMNKDVIEVTLHEELHTCMVCGYDRGFHASFVRLHAGHPHVRCILVCPECGARHDVGWITELK